VAIVLRLLRNPDKLNIHNRAFRCGQWKMEGTYKAIRECLIGGIERNIERRVARLI